MFPGNWRSILCQSLAEQPARTKRLDVDSDGYHVDKRLWGFAFPGSKRLCHQGDCIPRDIRAGHDLAYPKWRMKAEQYDE